MDTPIPRSHGWLEGPAIGLTGSTLQQLLDNHVPYVRIRNFASAAECEALVVAAIKQGFSPYRDVIPRIDRIGNTVFEHNRCAPDEYFAGNIEAAVQQQQMFAVAFDPLTRFMQLLRTCCKRSASIASSSNQQLYFAGLLRRIEQGTELHVDYAAAEQPGWEIAQVEQQLTWNLYLRVSQPGTGRTHVFNRQWCPADDVSRFGSYGYARNVVAGAVEEVFTALRETRRRHRYPFRQHLCLRWCTQCMDELDSHW